MFKNEDDYRYMHCTMQTFKRIALVCIYSLADQNIGHYVELTFFEGKLGKFFLVKV